jgi:hypothetical protein
MALRRPQSTAAGFAGLAALWLEGLTRAHDPGCGCGGFFVPVLNAQTIEMDLLDYLLARYRQLAHTDLIALIEARRSADASTTRFEDWIAGLETASLAPGCRALIEADLRTFLESLGGARGGVGVCY